LVTTLVADQEKRPRPAADMVDEMVDGSAGQENLASSVMSAI
jgi:hypothetical protein